MAGFDADHARRVLGIPEGFDPVAMLALGYRSEPTSLVDALKDRELGPRSRKELVSFVFGAHWQSPFPLSPRTGD